MPTIFSHAAAAVSLGTLFSPSQSKPRFWILTAVCAMLPDADVVGFLFDVPYGSMFGHRGFTHSLVFGLLIGVVVWFSAFRNSQCSRYKIILYFAAITFTHPILDMFTNGGLGVALFEPFTDARFYSPWRPIEASPIGVGFFSQAGVNVIMNELMWIWAPSLLIGAIILFLRRKTTIRIN
ncbi:MAG: metal-dependent hydrolase [Pyrinomonadaceae bacterium]